MIEVSRPEGKVSEELYEILKNAMCVKMKDLEDACITPANKDELKRYISAKKNILKAEKEYYERKFKVEAEDNSENNDHQSKKELRALRREQKKSAKAALKAAKKMTGKYVQEDLGTAEV